MGTRVHRNRLLTQTVTSSLEINIFHFKILSGIHTPMENANILVKVKGKAIPITGREGP
jgi:hypothetical protein